MLVPSAAHHSDNKPVTNRAATICDIGLGVKSHKEIEPTRAEHQVRESV